MAPKVSVILRAAARGVTARFDPQQMPQYQYSNMHASMQPIYDSRDYERAKDLAGALNGIAAIYEQIEDEGEREQQQSDAFVSAMRKEP